MAIVQDGSCLENLIFFVGKKRFGPRTTKQVRIQSKTLSIDEEESIWRKQEKFSVQSNEYWFPTTGFTIIQVF